MGLKPLFLKDFGREALGPWFRAGRRTGAPGKRSWRQKRETTRAAGSARAQSGRHAFFSEALSAGTTDMKWAAIFSLDASPLFQLDPLKSLSATGTP
jgi:hypothetical protein